MSTADDLTPAQEAALHVIRDTPAGVLMWRKTQRADAFPGARPVVNRRAAQSLITLGYAERLVDNRWPNGHNHVRVTAKGAAWNPRSAL